MFNPEAAVFAANKVLRELIESGAVGYAETTKKVIAPEAVLMINEEGVYHYAATDGGLSACEPMAGGERYIVTINGKVQKTLAVDVGEGVICFGNLSALGLEGFEDTGETFAGEFYGADGYAVFMLDGTTDPITISITTETETIHPIDPKFLPLDVVGFPVTMLNIVECGLPSLTVLIGRAIQNGGTFEAEYDVHGLWETVLGWSIGTVTEGKISPLWFTDGQNTMMVTGFGQKSINAIGCYYASGLLQIGCVLRTESMSASDKCTVSVFAKAV